MPAAGISNERALTLCCHPNILGGTAVFVGTRVPFRNLIDYLERNHSLDEFLDSFPTVSREQAEAALEAAHDAVSARAHSVDEQLPRQLAPYLIGHEVRTVKQQARAGLKNGALLTQRRSRGVLRIPDQRPESGRLQRSIPPGRRPSA
jgi:uncharacterized protein (DUF433 family)